MKKLWCQFILWLFNKNLMLINGEVDERGKVTVHVGIDSKYEHPLGKIQVDRLFHIPDWRYKADWINTEGEYMVRLQDNNKPNLFMEHIATRDDLTSHFGKNFNPSSAKLIAGWLFKHVQLSTGVAVDVIVRPKGMEKQLFLENVKSGKMKAVEFTRPIDYMRVVDVNIEAYSDVAALNDAEKSELKAFLHKADLS